MKDKKRLVEEVFSYIKPVNTNAVDEILQMELKNINKKIIVLDDDPTGVQTVHDISVYTDWTENSIEKGFAEENSMFFILTNSRGFTSSETKKAHKEIAENIVKVARKNNQDFTIISRSDSTLRGHYPLETQVLKETVEAKLNVTFDGEVIMPFFKEGGRFTIDDIHFVKMDEYLVPAGETEFAKDRTFGYTKSHLGEYVEEKSQGEYKAVNMLYISLESLRNFYIERIEQQLLSVENFNKIIVNAVDYDKGNE
jgi:uncharacterized protein YgbK (DUF1537 family)